MFEPQTDISEPKSLNQCQLQRPMSLEQALTSDVRTITEFLLVLKFLFYLT